MISLQEVLRPGGRSTYARIDHFFQLINVSGGGLPGLSEDVGGQLAPHGLEVFVVPGAM